MENDKKTHNSRIQSLVMRNKLDRIPVVMNIGTYAAYISNVSSYEYFKDPKKAYDVQMWAKKLHRHDGGLSYGVPSSNVFDFGGELEIAKSPRISLPKVMGNIVETPEDTESFKLPDFKKRKYVMKKFEFDTILNENGFDVSITSGSPLRMAGDIAGVELLMKWMYKEPSLVHKLLRISTDYILMLADWYIEEFGVENCSAFSNYPTDSHELISPKMFEKYSLPYIAEIHDKLLKKGIKKWSIHLCGNHTKNLKYWINDIKLHERSIITIGHEMDIEKVAKIFGQDHIIGGNVNTSLLKMGSANEVYIECEDIIKKMKNHPGGFILMPACDIPAETPPINLNALLEAANKFGVYN